MEKNLVSIITPSFNSEDTIARTIDSVLNQVYENIEYIIVDGGSTDGTVSIIKSYINKFNGRLKYISEPDDGIYDAMNKGIKISSGKLIGILSSNDYYELDGVRNIVEKYDPNQPLIIIYGMQRLFINGRESQVQIYNHEFMEKHIIPHPATFVGKMVYETFGLYSLEYKSSADYDFMLRIFKDKKVKFIPIYCIITNFNSGGISSTPIAGLETLKLRKMYGIINNKQYLQGLLWNRIIAFIKAIKKINS